MTRRALDNDARTVARRADGAALADASIKRTAGSTMVQLSGGSGMYRGLSPAPAIGRGTHRRLLVEIAPGGDGTAAKAGGGEAGVEGKGR